MTQIKMKMFAVFLIGYFSLFIISACDSGYNGGQGESTTTSSESTTTSSESTAPPSESTTVDNSITIPDISELDENTAKTLLARKGLIPKITYEYDDSIEEGLVVKTVPEISSKVCEDDVVTIIVSMGPELYFTSEAVGYIKNVYGIDAFDWGDNDDNWTKKFTNVFVYRNYLFISMSLKCRSNYEIEFYKDFGTASLTEDFSKSVPISVIYDTKKVDNNGGITDFAVGIPLEDLGTKKPTDVYIEFDFTVDGIREDFEAGFTLAW